MLTAAKLADTAAADPLLEPQALRSSEYGLWVNLGRLAIFQTVPQRGSKKSRLALHARFKYIQNNRVSSVLNRPDAAG